MFPVRFDFGTKSEFAEPFCVYKSCASALRW